MIMSKRIIALVVAAVIVALTFTACSLFSKKEEKENVFIMGIDPEYDPFSYRGDDGEFTGFDIDICKAVCDRLGWEFQTFSLNWENKLIQLDAKECDCVWSGMTILDSMKDAGYVLSAPYYDSTQVLLVKEDSAFKTANDLKGKIVAVELGTSGEKLLTDEKSDLYEYGQSVEIVTCESFTKCFTELAGNAADAVFVDKPVAEKYCSENEGFRIIDENLGSEQYGIAFRAGDEELCAQVERTIAELVADGTYKEIADKYPGIVNNLIFLY